MRFWATSKKMCIEDGKASIYREHSQKVTQDVQPLLLELTSISRCLIPTDRMGHMLLKLIEPSVWIPKNKGHK